MILVIDAGNTRIKWGLREQGVWRARGALATAEAIRLGEFRPEWLSVRAVLACSVAGAAVEATIVAALGPLAAALQWCRSGAEMQAGVVNRYTNPGQLGADRWAAMIGAWGMVASEVTSAVTSEVAGACLVVNAGTATTIDLLRRIDDRNGLPCAEFSGGVIVPGLALMRAALARNTAQLPLASGLWLEHPRATDDAIETGCIEAQVGAIERMARRLPEGSPCILSGGAAGILQAHLRLPLRPVEDLVLEGLARIAEENSVLT